MKRREFIRDIAIAGIGVYVLGTKAIDIKHKKDIDWLYNNASNFIIKCKSVTKYKDGSKDITMHGNGIFLDRYYLTPYHQVAKKEQRVRTMFGTVIVNKDVESYQVSIDDIILEEVGVNEDYDVAVFRKPYLMGNKKSFPYEIDKTLELGQKVYILGDPYHRGNNFRVAHISKLEGLERLNIKIKKDAVFGVDKACYSGDSGTPVVSDDLKLLGLVNYVSNNLGFITKIEKYMDIINKDKLL